MEQTKHLIIVVDDDREDQKLITMALRQDSEETSDQFEVMTVSSPEEMIEVIKNQEIREKYSPVILLDIKMPGRDGFDALQMIRSDEEIQHLPVVILSSTSSEKDVWKSYHLGANSFISKKIEFDDIIEDMKNFKQYWLKTVRKP